MINLIMIKPQLLIVPTREGLGNQPQALGGAIACSAGCRVSYDASRCMWRPVYVLPLSVCPALCRHRAGYVWVLVP
jgi:hypothetical protein